MGFRRNVYRWSVFGLLTALTGPAPRAAEFALIPNQMAIGHVATTTARNGETLGDVARRFDLGFTEVMAANTDLDPEGVIAGAHVVLPGFHILPDAPRQGIVVNLAAQRLFYFPDARHVLTFPIGVALAGHETPMGETTIVAKQRDPVWHPTTTIHADQPWLPEAIGPGPRNPLGAAALYLGWPSYLIHGTNRPDGIGRSGSYGCLSLYPEDILTLYRTVPVGTPVRTVRQNVAAAWIADRLIAQIYPNEEQGHGLTPAADVSRAVTADLHARLRALAAQHDVLVNWSAVDAARWDRTGLPVAATR